MNKRGFTLIELLAVIVVLAIIAVIAVPLVLNIIEKAKEGAFKNSVSGIVKAAEYEYTQNILKPGTPPELVFEYGEEGETPNIPGHQLNYSGKKPESGTLIIKRTGEIALALFDGTYCAEKDYDEIEVTVSKGDAGSCIAEVQKPSIELIGSNPLYIELNVNDPVIFVDPGVTAFNIDETPNNDITIEIYQEETLVNEINTSELGEYKIVYSVIDDGKPNYTERTVIIRDTLSPLITFPTDTVLEVSQVSGFDPLYGVSVTDNSGENIAVNVSGNISALPGTYELTYTAKDSSNNQTSITRTVTVIDNESPIVTFDPNGSSTWNKTHSTTVLVTDDTGVDNSSLKYLWSTSATAPTEGEFSNTFTNNTPITTNNLTGEYYLWVIAKDTSNNTTITRSELFNVDNIAPTINQPGTTNLTIEEVATFNVMSGVSATDAHSGISGSVTVSGNISALPGNYTLTYTVADNAGNITTINRTIIVSDVEAPVITILGNNPVTISAGSPYSDAGATAEDDVDGDLTSSIVVTGSVNPNVPGTYEITYTVTDSSNNTTTKSRTIIVEDTTKPTINFGTNGNSTWAKSHSTTITVTDVHSDVDSNSLKYLITTTAIGITENQITSNFNNGSTVNITNVTGDYYIWVLAKDTVGNTEIVRSNVFRLDNTAPVITLNGNSNVTINVGSTYTDQGAAVTDAHSGVTGGVVVSGSVNPNVPGTYQITYNKTDNVGNAASEVTRTVIVQDNVPPVVSFGTDGNSTWAQSHSTTVTVTDAHSSVDNSSLRYLITTTSNGINEGSFNESLTNGQTVNLTNLTGDYYVWVLAKDTVGNTEIVRSSVFKLDNTNPSITHPGTTNLIIQDVATFNLMNGVNATDSHSGINGNISVSGNISALPGSYTLTYSVSDNAGNSTAENRTIIVSDVEAPVITILGDNPVTIEAGSPYSDAGATALDDVDGDLTSSIVTTGAVNPNVPGTYTITYTVTDSSNNTTSKERTITVIDTTEPVVNFAPNGNDNWSKTHGVAITVTDVHSDVDNGSLRYLITTTSSGITENQITNTFSNGSTVNITSGTGDYYIWVLAKDTVGNTEIKRSNVFKLDNTLPVITLNGNSTMTLNVGDTYAEPGATVTDDHSGVTGNVVISGTVDINTPGIYQITYNKNDNAGNAATAVTRTVIVEDNVPPVVSFGTNGNSTWSKTHSTTINVTDAHSSIDPSSLRYLTTTISSGVTESAITTSFSNGGVVNLGTETGDYYVWVVAKDTAGNTEIVRSNVFRIDNTRPVITLNGNSTITINAGGTYTELGATVADDHSGVTGDVVISGSVNPNVPGTYTVTYNKSDNAGNAATEVTRTVIVQDNVPPVVSFGTNGNSTWGQSHSTTVTVTDEHSGVTTRQYQWTTSTSQPSSNSFNQSFTNGSSIPTPTGVTGNYYLWIKAIDSVNNEIITRSNVFRLDNTNPVITHPGTTTISVQDVTNFNAMSGVSASDAHSGVTGSVSISGNVSALPGTYTLTYSVSDNAGNSTTLARIINVVDTEAPVITILGDNPLTIMVGEPYIEPGATAIDDVDGDVTSSISVTSTVNPSKEGTYTVTYTVTDSSNNTVTAIRIVNVIEPILAIGTSGSQTNSFLGGPITKGSIESIVFANSKTVPGDAIGSWDVSASKNGSIIAWYTDNNSNELYELTIGSDGKIFANPNSSYLLSYLENLKTINFTNFDTSKVINTNRMFYSASSIANLDISSFDMSKVTNMSAMFSRMSNLTSLDLSNFDTSNVTNMSNMFHVTNSLTSLDISNFDTSNVTTMSHMFAAASSLESLDLSNFDTSKVTTMTHMFSSASSLTSLDISGFDTSKVTTMSHMFNNVSNLTSLDLSHFDTSNVTDMMRMFSEASSLTSLDISSFNTSKVTNMSSMFYRVSNLTSLDLSHFNTSNVTTMSNMFRESYSLSSLDISSFDTSKVTNMSTMFYRLTNLTSLDLGHFDTSNVTNMSSMFSGLSSLASLDVSNFDTSNVTNMSNMFSGLSNLTSLNLSSFDTSNVTNMSYMFSNFRLSTLDLSNFDTSNVTNMSYMFSNSRSSTLDFRNAIFINVSSYENVLNDAGFRTIYVGSMGPKEWFDYRLNEAELDVDVIIVW